MCIFSALHLYIDLFCLFGGCQYAGNTKGWTKEPLSVKEHKRIVSAGNQPQACRHLAWTVVDSKYSSSINVLLNKANFIPLYMSIDCSLRYFHLQILTDWNKSSPDAYSGALIGKKTEQFEFTAAYAVQNM